MSLHVGTGAAAGALLRSRTLALAAGPLLHLAGDRMPHQDIASRRFEIVSGIGALAGLALLCGPLDAATLGAAAASAPDIEHVLPMLRFRGRKIFPTHRIRGWHPIGGVSADVQLLVAGLLLGTVAATGARRR